ncbi:type II secretion system F family protein [Acetivibrio ethanolgignens]|uniref:Type II secretion system protein n=1 Tax=Acetivibrio ethanolgignens TaxID=290052 RepID=A0A0V8QAG6_9FIRM|nr:type II secretion system F family protein [Acetivibrio ethanolgignens]KSV57576.1 type II secretion system protein [Acetivibrio ethanolgignens]
MPTYNYVAIEKDGKEKKGALEAVSQIAARDILKANGLLVVSLAEPNFLNKEINLSIGARVKPRELGVFCRQFQSILEAGITVTAALQMLSEQTENKVFSKAIEETRIAVEKGETLAGAMKANAKIFPAMLINMVEAGEATGNLENAFERMAVQFEKDARLKAMVAKAMVYPVILIVVIISVVLLMMIKIVPTFVATFDDIGGELPAITRTVMAISGFLVNSWYYLLGALVVLVVAYRAFAKTERGAITMGRFFLRIPLFGNLNIKTASARLTRTLSTLLSSGISLNEATALSARQMSNRVVRKVIEDARMDVEQGIPLSRPIQASGVFPPMVCHMLQIGEETGNIEAMLDRVADYYDEEVEMATEALTAALEPLMIVVMALVVVPIILAILMPMFSIYSSIG